MPGIILLFLFSLNLCSVFTKPVVTTSFIRKTGESSSSTESEVPLSVTRNLHTLELFGANGQNNHQNLIQHPAIGVNLMEENEDENDPPDLETILNPTFYLINGEDDVVSEQTQPHHHLQRQLQGQKEEELGRERRNTGTSNGPSLSIVNPLDVLRQRLLMEISRRKMDQSNRQIIANAEILKNIGKRNWSS